MTYKCLECDHIFEEGEEASWEEDHGFSEPPYEKMSGCPMCRGSFEETEQCKICGSHYLWEELNEGVCEECFDRYKTDVKICYKIGGLSAENIKLNSFLTSVFDKNDIEKILFEKLEERKKYLGDFFDNECERFAKFDKNWFCENLVEEVKKVENKKN